MSDAQSDLSQTDRQYDQLFVKKKIIPPIDLQEQTASIRSEVDEAISRVIDTGNFILGDEVALFEKDCAEHIGVKHAVGLNSGTDALVIALRALGIGEGDEVITLSLIHI